MKKFFKNLNLIDGTGNDSLQDAYIIVEDGIIKEIGNERNKKFEEDCEIIDLEGKYLMPGMIDCHVHSFFNSAPNIAQLFSTLTPVDLILIAIKNLEKQLKSGVVFVRDVGAINYYDIQIKKYLQNGEIIGPDMYCAGKFVTMTGGHGHSVGREADGPVEVRKAVREQLKAGADVIKVMSTGGVMTPGVDVNAYQLNVDELKAAVEEAHKAGRKVCTHCHGTQGIKNSIIAGLDSIEHATLLDEEAIEMLVENGTYIVPTLVAPHFIVKYGVEGGIPKYAVDKAKQIIERHFESFNKAYKAGVKIAMGTDAGTPFNYHGKSAIELFLMTQAGMTAMDAIVTATKGSSELIGIEDKYGTLEKDKYANFIILSENPLENIETIQNPVSVYKKGKLA